MPANQPLSIRRGKFSNTHGLSRSSQPRSMGMGRPKPSTSFGGSAFLTPVVGGGGGGFFVLHMGGSVSCGRGLGGV